MTTVGPLAALAYSVKDLGHRMVHGGHQLVSARAPRPGVRLQNIQVHRAVCPVHVDSAFVAPSAVVRGNVILGENASIMYTAVIRNYHTYIPTRVGDNSTVQERCSILGQVRIGHDSVIGAGTVLDCCDIHDNVYLGAQSNVQLGCIIEDGAIVAPGTNLLKDTRCAAGTFWAGNPGVCIGSVTPEQAAEVQHLVQDSLEIAKNHRKAVKAIEEDVHTLDYDWLMRCCEKIESRHKAIKPAYKANIPMEARRFVEPRFGMKKPTTHYGVAYPVNRIAPWVNQMHNICHGNV